MLGALARPFHPTLLTTPNNVYKRDTSVYVTSSPARPALLSEPITGSSENVLLPNIRCTFLRPLRDGISRGNLAEK